MSSGLNAMRRVVPLLAAAREAEHVARDIAAAQARIAPAAALQRALYHQSRQEAVHAAAFTAALACLPGRAACPPRLANALAGFRQRLEADVAAGRLAASLFGLQHVLEALGHVALQPPGGELAGLGDQLVPLRGLLAQQELGHRRLGEVWVPRLAQRLDAQQRRALRDAGSGYLDLAREAVDAGLDACAGFADDRRYYAQATQECLGGLQHKLETALREPGAADTEQRQWGGHGGDLREVRDASSAACRYFGDNPAG